MRTTNRMRLLGIFMAAAAMLSLPACPNWPQIVGPGATTENKTIESIQSAINALNQNSASWQATLAALEGNLNADAKSLVANEVTNLMQRGVATVGTELRCNTDFIGNRMKNGLEIILAQLTKAPPPPPAPPEVCQVSPTTLDMGARPRELDFFGYDFDKGDVRVFMTYPGGETSLDALVSRPTHYLITVDTSPLDAATSLLCNREGRQIVLRANGKTLNSVGVTRMQCPGAPQAPAPPPPRTIVDKNEGCAGGLFGCSDNRTYGGPCSPGYHHGVCSVIKLEGAGHCEAVNWPVGDANDCTCRVHYGAAAVQGVSCRITLTEDGNAVGAPPPPACPCF